MRDPLHYLLLLPTALEPLNFNLRLTGLRPEPLS